MSQQMYKYVTRVEVIDSTGRNYVKYGITHVELSLQDDGRTLKLFLMERKSGPKAELIECPR